MGNVERDREDIIEWIASQLLGTFYVVSGNPIKQLRRCCVAHSLMDSYPQTLASLGCF